MNIPALWIGLYANANAGEIVWWTPDHEDCFRCLLERRYLKQAEQATDPPSDNALIQDLHIVDGIAGQIALALLTQGSPNVFGQLINRLGNRQFIHVKLRPDWILNGVDPVAMALQIPADNESYFCWTTAFRSNGPRLASCPDCEELRGRVFSSCDLIASEEPDMALGVINGDGPGDDELPAVDL